MDAKYNPVEVKVRETSEGVYSCSYVPKRGAKHTVQVMEKLQTTNQILRKNGALNSTQLSKF